MKGTMPVTTNSSYKSLIWSFWSFFAMLATLWHFSQLFINISSLEFLPYFPVDSGVEKNKGYERGHASHHQLVPPASKSHVILIFAQGRGPIFGVVVHKLPWENAVVFSEDRKRMSCEV